MRLPLRTWLLAGSISLSGAHAFAADAKTAYPTCTTVPTEADQKAAQGAFAAGTGSFNEADYPTAILYWRDAYRRDCRAHALLLNLASAYEHLGNRAEAINALEVYLQRNPTTKDPDPEQLRRRIDNMKAQMAAAAATPVAPVPAPAPAPTPAPTAPVASKGSSRTWPIVVAGVGGGLVGLGVIALAVGKGKENSANDACPSRKMCSAQATQDGNDAISLQKSGGGLAVLGVLAVGGGFLWYFLSAPSPDGNASHGTTMLSSLSPVVAPGFTGFSLSGGF